MTRAAAGERRRWPRRLTPAAGPPTPPPPRPASTRPRTGPGNGGDAATAANDDINDLASGIFSDPTDPISDPPTRKTAAIRTAKGLVSYDVGWDGTEGAAGPCLAAVKLLHVAQQSVDTSRWWTMRWPQNVASLIGRAGELSPDNTYKLMRALRKHALNYLDQLWMLTSDRRHEKDTAVLMTELEADWCSVQKLQGISRDKAGNLILGWIIMQRRSTYVITPPPTDQVDPALPVVSQWRLSAAH